MKDIKNEKGFKNTKETKDTKFLPNELKEFIYNYPILWFLIGYGLCFFTYPFYYKLVIVGGICFSFSVINIIANYNKERPIFKGIFWDCLPSVFFILFSVLFVLMHVNSVWYHNFILINYYDIFIITSVANYLGFDIYLPFVFVALYFIVPVLSPAFFACWFLNGKNMKDELRKRTKLLLIFFFFSKSFLLLINILLSSINAAR